jgi:putative copper export protein
MAVQVQVPTTRRATMLPVATGNSGPRWLVPGLVLSGLVALVGCLFLGDSVGAGAIPGLPDAGDGTRWGLPVASFIAETAAVLALGAALVAAALIPHRRGNDVRARCLTTAGYFSGLAAVATLVVFVVTLSDLTARPLPEALTAQVVLEVASFGPGLLLLVSSALSAVGAVVGVGAARRLIRGAARSPRSPAVLATGLMAAALIPWALGGHTAQSGQDIAASSLIVHVLAAGAWIGGLTIMVLSIRGDLLTSVLPRFSTLALWCWISIGVSGVITGWLRVGQVSDLWTSGYGRLLLVKLLCLGILGGFGAWHRRRITAGLRGMTIGQRGALLRVAAVEILVMGATMGVATALSATAPPVGHATGHDSAHGTSRIEAMAGHRVPVISVENLAVLWRPDVLVLLLVAVALTWYLTGVRRMRMTGANWPASRVCWAILAGVATVLVLNSGVASYDGVVWSVTVIQQAITSMTIPLAIAAARPWELSTAPVLDRIVDGLRARPWPVLAGYAAWTAACLLTPVALWSVSSHAVLMIVRIADIVVGTALFTALLSADRRARPGRRRPPSPTVVLMGWFAVQLGVAGALLSGGASAVRPWFSQLNLAWIDVAQDERTAALLHLGVAISVLMVAAALLPGRPPAQGTVIAQASRNPLPSSLFDTHVNEMRSGPIAPTTGSESPMSSTSVTADQRP